MQRGTDDKSQKIHNPLAAFEKPSDVVKDPELSQKDKKRALENLEQDAYQLMTASSEGMTQESNDLFQKELKLDEVVKAQQEIGEKPKNKPTE